MADATISRVGMRDLARLGRFQTDSAREAGSAGLCASWAEHLANAASIGEALGLRPRAAGPRPGTSDLMASSI